MAQSQKAKHKAELKEHLAHTVSKWIVDALLTGLTVLGGIVSLMTLYPRVTVTTSFDTTNPLSSSFLVSNDGYLPVYSVYTMCLVGEVNTQSGILPRVPKEKGDLGTPIINASIPTVTLDPGAKELVPFSNCLSPESPDSLSVGHVGLRVIYRPLLWPGERTFTQEFYAQRGEHGFFWYSVPYPK